MSHRFFWGGVFFAVAFVASFLLTGCKCGKDISGIHNETDSVRVEIRWRDVIVHDTVPFFVPVEVHTNVTEDSSHLETSFAVSDAIIDSLGRLHHSLSNKSQQINIPTTTHVHVVDTSQYESHTIIDSVKVPEPYPVYVPRELTEWQKFQMRGFWVLTIALLAYVIWLTRKFWKKVLSLIVK